MARPRSQGLTGRYQFRLDLRDAQQLAFAEELEALPHGQRNRVIIERLLGTGPPASIADIRAAMREVLSEYATAAVPHDTPPCVPDELFDTQLFK